MIVNLLAGCRSNALMVDWSEAEFDYFFANINAAQNQLLNNQGKLYAILVGVDHPHSSFTSLIGPSSEIKSLVPVLEANKYGVLTLENEQASRSRIIDCLNETIQRATGNDRILFYFTGHASTVDRIWDITTQSFKQARNYLPSDDFVLIPFQGKRDRIEEVIFMEEIADLMNRSGSDLLPANQRIAIIDACYGGHFINVSPLTTSMFRNDLPPDGFFALTSLKSEIYDNQYGPFILEGLRGEADCAVMGNHDGFVSMWELTNFLDFCVKYSFGDKIGENFSSRYIFIGSGDCKLTLTGRK